MSIIEELLEYKSGGYRFRNAIAEAVSRWLPTAAARVRAWVWQVGFMVDKVALGQVFSEYFGLPCRNRSFHELHHHHNHPGQLAEALCNRPSYPLAPISRKV
jgi:hypothetical protein